MIVRTVPTWANIGLRGSGQRCFLELHIGLQIDGSRFYRLVTEPECDYGTVDAVVKQVHCQRVSKHVRRHVLPGQ